MITTYAKQVKSINTAAAFFAKQGYQCEATFYGRRSGMMLTIFFKQIENKETLEKSLRRFADENDQIVFTDFSEHKFYTIKLQK